MPTAEELEEYLEPIIEDCKRLGFTEEETATMVRMETCKFKGLEDSDGD